MILAAGLDLEYTFLIGVLATVNPCGFVLLPTYLMYFLGMEGARPGTHTAAVSRALAVSAAVASGFFAVFLVIGMLYNAGVSWFLDESPWISIGIGALMVVLGIAMIFGFHLTIGTPKLDVGGKDRTVLSMFLYGVSYAVASIGCTLPLFSVVLFGTANREGYAAGIANVAAYGAGMALVVTALTVSLSVANTGLMKWLRSGMQYVEMLSGAFVLIAGAYLLWYFWKVDVQGETDPITDAVQRWQNDIQVFLNDHWQPVATVMLLVIVAAVAATLIGRRHRPPQLPPGAE